MPDFAEGTNPEFKLPLSESQFAAWVKANPKTYCSHAGKHYRWTKEFTKPELETLINKTLSIGTLQEIKLGDRGPAGTVKYIEVIGSNGSFKVEREYKIRQLLGGVFSFYSGKFILEKDKNPAGEEVYRFIGCGWGHGAGMCQEGAIGMSNEGKNYKDILLRYFLGTEIKKVY